MNATDPRLPLIAAEARVKTCHVFHLWHAMREAGKAFHRDAFAAFAGLERRHIDAIIEALEAHDALPIGSARSSATMRGSRLPNDWTLPEEWRDWAIAKRFWAVDDIAAEADQFACYWQAKTGKDATKADWFKTWQNWVRNSRRPDGTNRPNQKLSGGDRVEFLRRAIANYERLGRDQETGPWRRELEQLLRSNVIPMRREA